METFVFPPLNMAGWESTRDTLHGYCNVLGNIKKQLSPAQKHWWHASLRLAESGLTTAAIPAPDLDAEQFEIILDLLSDKLLITSSWGVWWEMPITGQSPRIFCKQVTAALESMGIFIQIDRSRLSDVAPYEIDAVQAFWQALSSTNRILKDLKAELPPETSQINFWPHNFDLSLMWLSGRKVPGADPSDAELADEQISFGLSFGDKGIPDPYFYTTIYAWIDEITRQPLLIKGAVWNLSGWKGALLMYDQIRAVDYPEEKVIDFFRAAFLAGYTFMK
jgi:hypothetical protein